METRLRFYEKVLGEISHYLVLSELPFFYITGYGDRGGRTDKKVELTLFNFGFLRLHKPAFNFYWRKDASNMETGTVVLSHIASPEK